MPNVGSDNAGREHFKGRRTGMGTMENGEFVVDFCEMNDLVIGGEVFPHCKINKVTWRSPDTITENQIDHIAVSRTGGPYKMFEHA